MGIPSFYRQLCRRHPQLIQRGCGPRPAWFCLDFNCAMYTVLRTMPPIAEAPSQRIWEDRLCDAIAGYLKQLVGLAAPTTGVIVSCDGVVCAAKRKQQRLRRFKGPWMAAAEAEVRAGAGAAAGDGVTRCNHSVETTNSPAARWNHRVETTRDPVTRWDQNALTPGTAFMERLGETLTRAGRRLAADTGLAVSVSTTAEPGEGEHKLLAQMRTIRPVSCTIYGLDADLILLSMLLHSETGADVRLLREAQEFERAKKSGSASDFNGEWRTLHVSELSRVLIGHDAARVRDYVAAMSLLGNDFLPRSLTHTVRDDGIQDLLRSLESTVWSAGLRLVGADGRLQRDGLLALLRPWAAAEAAAMRGAAEEAVRVAYRPAGDGADAADAALREWNASPARWCAMRALLAPGADWRAIYASWGPGRAEDYLAGLAWVWDYYAGRPVDLGWVFTEHLPPLWSDVVAALERGPAIVSAPPVRWSEPLPAWAHLLSVLPADSVRALLPKNRQAALAKAPWYWPSAWSLFDVGRTQMWECEPVIPVPPESVVRGWVGGSGST